MIVIVDKSARARSLSLRDRFLNLGVPCALCTARTLSALGGAPVTICFAAHEDDITRASLHAGRTALIAVNVSGRHMYHPDAIIWDESRHGDLVTFALKTARERTGIDLDLVAAGGVRVERGAVSYLRRRLSLTDTERLLVLHLAIRPDVFCAEREVRKFICSAGDLRLRRSSVSVHAANVNRKAVRSAGSKLIACRRGHGYAILTSPPTGQPKRGKPGFVPPFS